MIFTATTTRDAVALALNGRLCTATYYRTDPVAGDLYEAEFLGGAVLLVAAADLGL